MPSRAELDNLWMDLAIRVSHLSKDPSTKVGAVVVREDRELSLGYNGMPRGIPEPDWLWERPLKYLVVQHAERNAIIQAPFDTAGCTVYCTHQPCPDCLGLMINAGIRRVLYAEPYAHMSYEQRRIWTHISESFTGEIACISRA